MLEKEAFMWDAQKVGKGHRMGPGPLLSKENYFIKSSYLRSEFGLHRYIHLTDSSLTT